MSSLLAALLGGLLGLYLAGLSQSVLVFERSGDVLWQTAVAGSVLAFGLGTLPLLGMSLFAHQIQPLLQRVWVRRAAGLVGAGLGMWGLAALSYSRLL